MSALPLIVAALVAIAGTGVFLGLASLLPSALSVAGSGLVAFAVFKAGRTQDRIRTTLELHKEFYSPTFAASRRDAEHFYQLHHERDWGNVNPYELDDPEDKLKGYSEVLRYFHRLSILWQRDRLDEELLSSLFSREMGYWMGLIFEPMSGRTDWWTKSDILKLAAHLGDAGSESYRQGEADGSLRRLNGPIRTVLPDGTIVKSNRDSASMPIAPDRSSAPGGGATFRGRVWSKLNLERWRDRRSRS